jgi:hypothetical protein
VRGLVGSHGLGVFECAAGFQVGRDASRVEGVASYFALKPRSAARRWIMRHASIRFIGVSVSVPAAHRVRRVGRDDLTGDHPVEQHADGCEVLLDRRLLEAPLHRSDVGGNMQLFDVFEIADAVFLAPAEEPAAGPTIGMRVFLLRIVAPKNSRNRFAAWSPAFARIACTTIDAATVGEILGALAAGVTVSLWPALNRCRTWLYCNITACALRHGVVLKGTVQRLGVETFLGSSGNLIGAGMSGQLQAVQEPYPPTLWTLPSSGRVVARRPRQARADLVELPGRSSACRTLTRRQT